MKAWLMALVLGRRRELVTKTFTANATVPIPQGVSRLESIVGKGGNGRPSSTEWFQKYQITRVENRRRRSDGIAIAYGSPVISTGFGSAPGSYCEPPDDHVPLPNDPVYSEKWFCYYYSDTSGEVTSPATTGASATGFGQTFVGGYGGSATPRTVNNVAVTPGGSYQLVIPSGGSITISYYQ